MAVIGESDYRDGARERLAEASVLLRQELFAGSIYLAGRDVEGMLRALIWKSDREYAQGKKALTTGHDLKGMLKLVGSLGVLRQSMDEDVQKVWRLWSNDMRFWPTREVQRVWKFLGEISGRRTMKVVAQAYYDACSRIVKRCEALWKS